MERPAVEDGVEPTAEARKIEGVGNQELDRSAQSPRGGFGAGPVDGGFDEIDGGDMIPLGSEIKRILAMAAADIENGAAETAFGFKTQNLGLGFADCPGCVILFVHLPKSIGGGAVTAQGFRIGVADRVFRRDLAGAHGSRHSPLADAAPWCGMARFRQQGKSDMTAPLSLTAFQPQDPHFEQRVRDDFARQTVMTYLGAALRAIAPGACEVALPYRPEMTQQDGFFHAGIIATVADTAAGYAAFSLMPADASVLSIEFKQNMMAPAVGDTLVARALVDRAGRTITVVSAEVFTVKDGMEKKVAKMQATMMCVRPQ